MSREDVMPPGNLNEAVGGVREPPYVGACSESTGGYLGILANRIGNPMLTDAWIAEVANGYDVSARCEIDAARELVLDRPYRHIRKARHLSQAHHFALHARALRELLAWRQSARRVANADTSDASDKVPGRTSS